MFATIEEVTLEKLQSRASMIHYFGLGFIQVKLGPIFRMHFYTAQLPRIVDEEDVHNHRYDFLSNILRGELLQELFVITDGNTHILEKENCKENGTENHAMAMQCGLLRLVEQKLPVKSWYNLSHQTLHRVKASSDGCITLVKRDNIVKEYADVAHKIGTPKICPFSKKVQENELWGIIGSMLAR